MQGARKKSTSQTEVALSNLIVWKASVEERRQPCRVRSTPSCCSLCRYKLPEGRLLHAVSNPAAVQPEDENGGGF